MTFQTETSVAIMMLQWPDPIQHQR